MARNRVGEKKVKKLREKTGLPVLTALVRGGTDHRIDLLLEDGSIASLYRDGSIEKDTLVTWDVEKWKREHNAQKGQGQ